MMEIGRRLKKFKRGIIGSVKVKKDQLKTLWYGDENDNMIWVDIDKLQVSPSKAKYQHAQFPRELTHHILKLNNDGTSREVGSFTSTYPIDIVIAIYEDGGYTWDQAVILVANSCERCMNALAYQYGLDWGYSIYSKEWHKAGTSCVHCR